jgi:O-acetyl-ADP-ribose deacetylase (regulator of RNase III)
MEIRDSLNPYLATKAIFTEVDEFNSVRHRIDSVSIPSLRTGVGNVPFSVAARQMRSGDEDIVLDRIQFTEHFSQA